MRSLLLLAIPPPPATPVPQIGGGQTPGHPIEWACNAPVLLQGGSFNCDLCIGYPTLKGPHRGAAIADGANLLAELDPEDPEGPEGAFFDDLLIGGTAGVWLKASSAETDRTHTGTVVLYRGDVAGVPAGATGTLCLDDDSAHRKLISPNFGDLFGFSVTAIGDLDDDTYDDFIVGAPRGPFSGTPMQPAPWEGGCLPLPVGWL